MKNRDQKWRYLLLLSTALAFINPNSTVAENESGGKKGVIKGKILDKDTQLPLIGVNVLLKNTSLGAATDKNGGFIITNVPVGSYIIQFRYIGYEPFSVTDVIVRSNRNTFINAELTASVIEGEQVVVSGGYFPELKEQPTSAARFSSEEIRRAATIGGDISRIINGLPSLSNENQNNYIVARGGSVVENSFYIDNINVPNINHFPIPGTTGGGISLLNIDFIKDINVYTGGFSACYGDVLSSVMDISYREGNRDEIDLQADLNFTGVSGTIEGPLGKGKGSYLFSAKHSFTDILFAIIDIDQEPVIYDEFQGKVVYDLTAEHQIGLLYLFGKDRWKILRDEAISRSDNGYGSFDMIENVIGFNWRYLWGKQGFSRTCLSHSYINNDIHFHKTTDQTERFTYQSVEQKFELRNINYFTLGVNHHLEFGFEIKNILDDYDNSFAAHINQSGSFVPSIRANNFIRTWKSGLFLNYTWNPAADIDISPGLRLDYFSYTQHALVSPRLALTCHIDEKTAVNGAVGLYYQNLPMFFLAQNPQFRNLKDMSAYHFILGFNHLFLDDLRLSVEIYRKLYRDCPMDPAQAALFILDENIYNQFYSFRNELVTKGQAQTSGIELMLQKKFSGRFYGLFSGAYYRAKYRGLDDVWRNRVTDNRYLFASEIGYKPDSRWEFNLRWSYAGGIPYTPYDRQLSLRAGTGIYDRSKIMAARLPAYSCLNIRMDRRFHFAKSNMIVYLSIWNLLNRENYSYHFWDEYGGGAGNYTQWQRLPVFGFELEF